MCAVYTRERRAMATSLSSLVPGYRLHAALERLKVSKGQQTQGRAIIWLVIQFGIVKHNFFFSLAGWLRS